MGEKQASTQVSLGKGTGEQSWHRWALVRAEKMAPMGTDESTGDGKGRYR